MKSDQQIMNELAAKTNFLREVTPEESAAQKKLLLEMYKDIARVCDAHNLVYMLGGGTCLGAIRHKGYIPWDDDLDLMMPRDSYEKLIQFCDAGELGDKYEIDTPRKNHDCKNPFLKVFRKGTLDVELQSENTPFPKGVFIDIFPMDSAPRNRLMQKLKGFVSDAMRRVCTSVLYAEYPSQKYHEFMSLDKEALSRYKTRVFIGKLFGIFKHKRWVWWFDQFNSSSTDTGYTTVPTGRKGYVGEILPTSVFVPTQKAMFEGIEANVPADYDAYLTSLYKNYMAIPPVEKRERHQIYILKLSE